MRVTVVIPARSPAPGLSDAVASAADQTQPPAEIFVIDDGLNDEDADVGPSARIIVGESRGAGAARNMGIQNASGELVSFLDADDLWAPRHLAATVASLAAAKGAAVCFGGAMHLSDDGAPLARFVPDPRHTNLRGLLTRKLQPTVSATSARREALLEVGGFYEDFSQPAGVEDIDLWWRLARGYRCVAQPEPLVAYFVHQDRDRARTREELTGLSADRSLCIDRIRQQLTGRISRQAAAQHRAIMARYWYTAGFGGPARAEALRSLAWWPTVNGITSLAFGLVPSSAREPLRRIPRRRRTR